MNNNNMINSVITTGVQPSSGNAKPRDRCPLSACYPKSAAMITLPDAGDSSPSYPWPVEGPSGADSMIQKGAAAVLRLNSLGSSVVEGEKGRSFGASGKFCGSRFAATVRLILGQFCRYRRQRQDGLPFRVPFGCEGRGRAQRPRRAELRRAPHRCRERGCAGAGAVRAGLTRGRHAWRAGGRRCASCGRGSYPTGRAVRARSSPRAQPLRLARQRLRIRARGRAEDRGEAAFCAA